MKPLLKKQLKDELKYVQPYATTGVVAVIFNVPIYFSKALPHGIVYCATNKAVTAFIKKGVSVESDRDIDTKLNRVVGSRYAVIALTDETECVVAGKNQETAATITTAVKETTALAGAATDGAKVTAYVNGKKSGNIATAASSAYSITLDEALAVDDKVVVIAELESFLPSVSAEFTVVA